MPASCTLQLVVFRGAPASLGQIARQTLQRGGEPRFLCMLEPGESAEPVRRAWEFSVQPLSLAIHLMILHEPRGRAFEGIAEFAAELMRSRADDLDVLFVSEESSWLGSRHLARELKGLQESLQKASTNCLVRRV